MAITEKVRIVVDVVTGQAKSELNNLKGSVNQTGGMFDTLKSKASGVGSFIQANMASMAAGAGAALVAFGVKAVNTFQDLALSAGKFADATGVTTEEASRLIEVFGDIGVEAPVVQSAINRMNKEIATNRSEWEQLGVVGGSTQETFTNVIGYLNGIKDPAERAREGTKLLGKGWTEMAEVIEGGSDSLTKSLSEVSDAKIIDEGEARKAREFRDALDELNGYVEDLTLMVGGYLVPQLTTLAETISGIKDAVDVLPDVPGWMSAGFNMNPLTSSLKMGFDATDMFRQGLDELRGSSSSWSDESDALAGGFVEVGKVTDDTTGSIEDEAAAAKEAEDATRELNRAADEQAKLAEDAAKALDLQEKATRDLIDAQLSAVDTNYAAADAWDTVLESIEDATDATDDSETAINEKDAAQRKAEQSILRYAQAETKAAEETAKANGQQFNAQDAARVQIESLEKVKAKFPELAPVIDSIIGKLQTVSKPITTSVSIYADISDWNTAILKVKNDLAAIGSDMRRALVGVPAYQAGGPVPHSGFVDVGEAGRERVFLPGGSYVANHQQTLAMDRAGHGMMGGNSYAITVNVNPGTQPADVGRELVKAISAYERANGSGWRRN